MEISPKIYLITNHLYCLYADIPTPVKKFLSSRIIAAAMEIQFFMLFWP